MFKILILCITMLISQFSYAQNITTSHAIALRGEPKYAADFKHWDYVNPKAPKGGYLPPRLSPLSTILIATPSAVVQHLIQQIL